MVPWMEMHFKMKKDVTSSTGPGAGCDGLLTAHKVEEIRPLIASVGASVLYQSPEG